MPEWTTLKECKLFAFLPPGIFYWLGRAKKEATINATIGSAYGACAEIGVPGEGHTTFYLPGLMQFFNELSPNEIFPYAPILGVPEFRAAWRAYILEKLKPSGKHLDALISNPAVAPGVTGALAIVSELFLSPSETAILPDRYWENYDNVICSNVGARITTFPFYDGGDFNVAAMKAAVDESLASQGKAVVVLNFPNNPTGFSPCVATAERIAIALEESAVESGKWVIVLCDDAYEGFVYDKSCLRYSVFAEVAGRRNILAVKLDGISKEFLFYGGRIACITFGVPETCAAKRDLLAKELEEKVGAVIRSSISNCSHPVQQIIRRAIAGKMGVLLAERQRVIEVMRRRWEVYNGEMAKADQKYLKPLPSNSGFFSSVDLVSAKATEVADLLMREYKVGVVPSESAGQNSLRIAFCSVSETDIPKLVYSVMDATMKLSK
jgi:aspartate/methionine/tyrosine aminotransferase